MDDIDFIPVFFMSILGIILGIFIGHFNENEYGACFIKDDYIYCEKKDDPEDIKRIGALKGSDDNGNM